MMNHRLRKRRLSEPLEVEDWRLIDSPPALVAVEKLLEAEAEDPDAIENRTSQVNKSLSKSSRVRKTNRHANGTSTASSVKTAATCSVVKDALRLPMSGASSSRSSRLVIGTALNA